MSDLLHLIRYWHRAVPKEHSYNGARYCVRCNRWLP